MRIAALESIPVRVGLATPIHMASGTIDHTDNVLVRITSDDGRTGWGEGVEAPAVTGETQADILAGIEMPAPTCSA